jgi:hypothetical protein
MSQVKAKGVSAIVRQAPKGSHSSNGGVERLIGKVDAMARTFREHVQVNYKFTLPDDHILLPWIIRHAGWIDARYQVHKDGRTAFQRLKNVAYASIVVPFSETVLGKIYVPPTGRDKLKSECVYGIWVGRTTSTNTHILLTPGGTLYCRSIRRVEDAERYVRKNLDEAKGLPWSAVGTHLTKEYVFPVAREIQAPPVAGIPMLMPAALTATTTAAES